MHPSGSDLEGSTSDEVFLDTVRIEALELSATLIEQAATEKALEPFMLNPIYRAHLYVD